MIEDVKYLLNLLGVSYIHPKEGEGEAYASELCRIGYVDYVLTEAQTQYGIIGIKVWICNGESSRK